ncbi:MAG: GxxExxY protein [Ignavibacteriales bacterium]|nr:GxxExxY protein [Ignavibacteriales bacterium]
MKGGKVGDLLFSSLTEKIIAAAFRVHNILGKGLSEHTYRNALLLQLRSMGLKADVEKGLSIFFDGTNVGSQSADIVVEDRVILELKTVQKISPEHLSKLLSTLKNTKYQLGLVINFTTSVQVKRVINTVQNK